MINKCPICELNYLKNDEYICSICNNQKKNNLNSKLSNQKRDFSSLRYNYNYGTNSKKIYEEFCNTLGWDKSKSECFGWQTPLFASNADKEHTKDVWFIFHANYNKENFDSISNSGRPVLNYINKKENYIIECLDENLWGESSNNERITFARMENGQGYEFLGTYKLKNQHDGVRVYVKIE